MTTEREDSDNADSMLLRLQQQLDEIDTREMMRGSTDADLKEKGFIGDKRISIDRATSEQGTDPEHLFFQAGVEYERIAGSVPYAEITIDKLLHLTDVAATELIAYRAANERIPFDAGENVRQETDGSQERYFALQKGKAIIIGNRLHIVPSDIDCTVSISIAPDKMSALADCAPGYGTGTPLTVAGIKSALGSAGAFHGHLDDAIAALVDKANGSLTRQLKVVVAAGTPPRQGRPGAVKYTFDTSEQEYDFKILPDGRIDYKNTRNIVMASAGDTLATLADPIPGLPGVDVLGQSVPAKDGQIASLLAGAGVRVSQDGKQIIAELNGSVVLNGSIIEVVDTFVVNGDVDYSTGNIDFNGNVFIAGNIVEGFGVKANGDIVVMKNVESSRVEAGRDAIIKGGVQGKGKGLIAAGRDIKVGFAQNARLEAQGNIIIGNFAVNSYIFTSRQLTMTANRGAVIGGEVYAQRGVEVRSIGSESGVKTFVEVGSDFLILKKIAEIDEEIEFTQASLRKIDDTLKTIAVAMKKKPGLAARSSLIKKAFVKREEFGKRLRIMAAKRTDLLAQSREKEVCFVKVSGKCYADVQVKIHDARTVTDKSRDAIRFYEDRKDGTVKTGAY